MASHADVPPGDQLRAAVSILSSAAADRQWGGAPVVRVRAGGLQLGDGRGVVDAAAVYQAARGLVGALLDDLVQSTGRDLDDVVGPWLLSLEVREAFAGVDGV
ncbi:hypothetical protein [Petropleomorpha daqingensis]|uniref:Uncharacterized protein n=1 Tax=Petropleomorpha daqingensis TaxID=2026353 RepID=A0A853CLW4_9ACTN|nr:hypothetical protein [Petropleomorpha daqingensis]NYJ07522.1 hypothetical protein [Petropleomorpha daqingensis]